jgi:hypothetical protein
VDAKLQERLRNCTSPEERDELCKRHVLPPYYDPNDLVSMGPIRVPFPHQVDLVADSIAKDGQQVPVFLHGKTVVDGWFRVLACRKLGILVRGDQMTDAVDPEIISGR